MSVLCLLHNKDNVRPPIAPEADKEVDANADVEEEEVDNADKVGDEDKLKKNKTKTDLYLNGYLMFRIAIIFQNL